MNPLSRTVEIPDHALDLHATLRSGQIFRWSILDGTRIEIWDGADQYLVEGVHLDATPGEAPDRELTLHTDAPEGAFERFLRLDWNANQVNVELIEKGPELEPYLAAMRGIRLLRPSNPVEILFTFLCTPNNHLLRIKGMVENLARFGEDAFPTVEEVAAIPPEALWELRFGYRARTIPFVAHELKARGGDAYVHSLKGKSYETAVAELISIKHIGRKLADCIALFALDQTCAVPVDTHIWQAATRLYFPQWRNTSLTEIKYRAVGDLMRERFGERAGWAQQALFFENVLNWRSRK
ncbi:DNA-3-methyladenine glycosylase [soil metagenome]